MKPNTLKGRIVFVGRHGLAICCLWFASQALNDWYLYLGWREHLRFFVLLLLGILLGGGPFLRDQIRNTGKLRVLIVAVILFFSLPWGEWLRLNFAQSREDWSRQIFQQTVFLYAMISLLRMTPSVVPNLRDQIWLRIKAIKSPWVLRLIPVLFFLLSAWIGVFLYDRTPLTQDTSAYLFQAKIFETGKLFAPEPPNPDFFAKQGDMLAMKDGRWFQVFSPGFPLLLSAFLPFHLEWLVCPLLGALTIALWMAEIRRRHGHAFALLFGVFSLFSPFLLLMSSTVVVHNPELFITSAIIILSIHQTEKTSGQRSLILLLLMTAAVLVRGFSILPFLAPVLVTSLWMQIRRREWKDAAAVAAGFLIGLAMLAAYQKQITGNPLVPGYLVEYENYHYGFGKNIIGIVHTPARGLENTSNEILGMNLWLTGWHTGWLPFLISLIITTRRFKTWDLVLTLSCLSLTAFYYFFVIQDLVIGPRFLYVTTPILLLFLCRNFELWEENQDQPPALAPALILVSLSLFVVLRFTAFLQAYHPAANQATTLKEEVERVGGKETIVFLDRRNQNFVNWNDPFLREPVVYCVDLSSRNQELLSAFPGYQARYFRQTSSNNGLGEISYSLADSPDNTEPGHVSLFELALTIHQAVEHPAMDLFDVVYASLFDSPHNDLQYKYLEEKEQTLSKDQSLHYYYAAGLIRTGKFLLLPRCASLESPQNWFAGLDKEEFRNENRLALESLKKAGELGVPLLAKFEQLDRRIDQNRDHFFSDEEIHTFLSLKLSNPQ